MKMKEFKAELNRCAADALTSALSGVSTLKLKAIRCESDAHGSNTGFMAHVDVLGRPHVLACEVKAEGQPTVLRETLLHLHDGEAELEPNVTRVLIAPYLSPQAQALCMQNHAGYLDLVGNARIEIGEVFIRQRMLQNVDETSRISQPASAAPRGNRHSSRSADTAHFTAAA